MKGNGVSAVRALTREQIEAMAKALVTDPTQANVVAAGAMLMALANRGPVQPLLRSRGERPRAGVVSVKPCPCGADIGPEASDG
jgi:hypothetical protein